jgi:hypothetical protein
MKKRFGRNNKERGREMQYHAKEGELYKEVAVKIRKNKRLSYIAV